MSLTFEVSFMVSAVFLFWELLETTGAKAVFRNKKDTMGQLTSTGANPEPAASAWVSNICVINPTARGGRQGASCFFGFLLIV